MKMDEERDVLKIKEERENIHNKIEKKFNVFSEPIFKVWSQDQSIFPLTHNIQSIHDYFLCNS